MYIDGQWVPSFIIYIDVLQGAPLSSIFFVLSTDPLVMGSRAAVDSEGIFRMCADDVGISLWDIHAMIAIRELCVLEQEATTGFA